MAVLCFVVYILHIRMTLTDRNRLFIREAVLELCLPSTGSRVVDGMAMVDDHHLGLIICFFDVIY